MAGRGGGDRPDRGNRLAAQRPLARHDGAGYRGVESRSITSALPPEATLPRAQPVLRWAGVPGARYRVRVLTPDLQVLEVSAESDVAEYRVSDETLRRIDAGGYILWQVEGRIPGDTVIVSPTFRVRVD